MSKPFSVDELGKGLFGKHDAVPDDLKAKLTQNKDSSILIELSGPADYAGSLKSDAKDVIDNSDIDGFSATFSDVSNDGTRASLRVTLTPDDVDEDAELYLDDVCDELSEILEDYEYHIEE